MSLEELALLGKFSGKNEVWQDFANMYGETAAACSLLPKLMQEIVRRGWYSKGHYDARQLWLDLIEKSNSLTRPEEVCRLIVEAVRAVEEEGK